MRILYALRVRSSIFTSHESCHLPSGSVVTVVMFKIVSPGALQFTLTTTSYVTQASRLSMTKELFVVVSSQGPDEVPSHLMIYITEQLSSPFVVLQLTVMLREPGSRVKFPICPATTK